MITLAFETSCDDTSVAIIRTPNEVLALRSASQDSVHQPFGGVVPEIASRNHTLSILPLVQACLDEAGLKPKQIDLLSVTSRPGLIGALMVGVVTAKTLSLAWQKPLVGVNHLVGHLYAPFLRDANYSAGVEFPPGPFLALTISGGHSALYHVHRFGKFELLGETVDDAAGEAFDKLAKMVGFDYPGGVHVDRAAQQGNIEAFKFPRPFSLEPHLNFSFSGLKSSAHRLISQMSESEVLEKRNDICASFQEAVVDSLLIKLQAAQKQTGLQLIVLTGGVSANSRLRAKVSEWTAAEGLQLCVPPLRYCTDNAAMIGLAGLLYFQNGDVSDHDLSPLPHSLDSDFVRSRAL